MTEEQPQFDELPAQIVARLRAADRAEPSVDLATERAVLHSAERYFHFRRAPRTAARMKRLVPMAAAAVVLLALLIVQPVERLRHPDDVDGSGRVDILDAFALARLPDGGEASAALATRVVALNPRSAR